jgi:hypothetical protein
MRALRLPPRAALRQQLEAALRSRQVVWVFFGERAPRLYHWHHLTSIAAASVYQPIEEPNRWSVFEPGRTATFLALHG